MDKKETPAVPAAKGRSVDLSIPNLSTAALNAAHRRHLEKELGSKRAVRLAYAYGACSITLEEAREANIGLVDTDRKRQFSSGLLFPYVEGFAQLRCDVQPFNRKGDECKYLTPCGCKFTLKVFGGGDPVIATEGWKDAFRIHLETGLPTVALPSVSGWKIIPPSVKWIVYDADAAHNHSVWGALVRAGILNKKARIGFFDRKIAGAKGGACEFFNNGGNWADVEFTKPRALVRELYKEWPTDLRADYRRGNIRTLIRCLDELQFDPIDSDLLLRSAARRIGVLKDEVEALQERYRRSLKSDDAPPDEPKDTHGRVLQITEDIGHLWRADYASNDSWLQYTGTHWARWHGNDRARRAIWEVYDSRGWVKRESRVKNSDLAGFRDAVGNAVPNVTRGMIPFSNGMLRLSDEQLLPHDPKYGNDFCLPYPWLGPEAPANKFDAFLKDRLGDEASVALVYSACFVALTGAKAKIFIELTGASDSGKSVVASVFEALVGKENCVSGSLFKLEAPMARFETIRYRGKRLAIFPESGKYSGPLETIKAMTGRDTIPAELKGVNGPADYVFEGLVLVIGNEPIHVSEASGAVYNRRRGIHISKVVQAKDQQKMLELEHGKWVGELADQLPGLAAKVLSLDPVMVRQALRKDVRSIERVKHELHHLLKSDHFARWTNESLVWDVAIKHSSVGTLNSDDPSISRGWLYPHYRNWLSERENVKPVGQSKFKTKLVSLLRDSLGLPLPHDEDPRWRVREVGSVVPHIRLRTKDDDPKGIIEWASLKRAGQLAEQSRNGENPVGNKRNAGNASQPPGANSDVPPLPSVQQTVLPLSPPTEAEGDKSVPPVPPIP